MKKLLISTVLLTLCIGSAVIINSNNNLKPSNINTTSNQANNNSNNQEEVYNNDSIAIQNSISYYSKYYDSIAQLINDSSIIIKGKVVSAIGISNKNGTISTDLEVQVDSILNDSIENNQIIKLRSRGGVMDYNDYIKNIDSAILEKSGLINSENTPNEIINYADGIKQYEVGDSVILFLDEYNPKIEINPEKDSENSINNVNLTENKYVIVGDTQGKFYYDESTNEIFRYKLSEKLTDPMTFNLDKNKELETNFEEFTNMF